MKDVKEIAKNNPITNYVRDCFYELTKVTWPTKNQAIRLTVIVLGFCLVFAVFLAGVDFFANEGYTKVLDWAFKFAAGSGAGSVAGQ